MKILCIDAFYFPAIKYGGPIFSHYNLDRGLVSLGIKVDVYTTFGGLDEADKLTNQVIDGINIKRFRYYGYEHFTFSPRMLLEVIRNAKNYDLIKVGAVWNFTAIIAWFIYKMYKIPYVVCPHGTLLKTRIDMRSSFKKKLLWNIITKNIIKDAKKIHFTTNYERDDFNNSFYILENSFVIPNCFDFNEFNHKIPSGYFKNKFLGDKNKKYILFLGRLAQVKGIDILLESYLKILEKYSINLVFVGPDYGYKKEIQEFINKNKLSNYIYLIDTLTGDDKISAYHDSECFVLSSYSENFGMTAIEAMACKTPVIISDQVGIYKEVYKNNAGLICSTNVESLTEKLLFLLSNDDVKKNLIMNAYKFIYDYYSVESVAKQMLNEFEVIVKVND